ncbi:hypothetical protein [Desulfobacter vibrioformis]|uniref:hypothetical protein n=1 Tax=Desulfobacter vibrioformis TaxID=34031 RepID=UPI0005548D89|nr:hypothetical protein [Desulfobacter vibrioformis]
MERIDINTQMDGFHLLTSVTDLDKGMIGGTAAFVDQPAFVAMESLAQLGALHVRWLCDFSKHAFLLKVECFSLPSERRISGLLELSGRLLVRSQAAFSYDLTVSGIWEDPLMGRFLFSVKEYDDTFEKEVLTTRYREVFQCLTSASGTV